MVATLFSYETINMTLQLFSACNVFIMQLGFCMLEAGTVRKKNIVSILIKNMQDSCVCALCYWFCGYAIAYGPGPDGSKSIYSGANGNWGLFLHDVPSLDYGFWFFQMAFAATICSILSGAVAERCNIDAYLIYVIVTSSVVYPVISCWIWNPKGCLNVANNDAIVGGVIDFAGGSAVHYLGGLASLIACYFIGPRTGRFLENPLNNHVDVVSFSNNSQPMRAIGVFMLWYGWYSFNAGSALSLSDMNLAAVAQHIMVTTTLSAASCAVLSMILHNYWLAPENKYEMDATVNGILAGLVSITAGCAVMEPYAAMITGFIGAFVWIGVSKLLLRFKIDDVVDAVAVHAGCGTWGLIASALFAKENLTGKAYGAEVAKRSLGLFYGGTSKPLWAALLAIIMITAFAGIIFCVLFFILNHLDILRSTEEEEFKDMLDEHMHGGAYNSFQMDSSRAMNPSIVEEWNSKRGFENRLDKTTLMALAYSQGLSDIMDILKLFDDLSGGAGTIEGKQYESFIEKLKESFGTHSMHNSRSGSPLTPPPDPEFMPVKAHGWKGNTPKATPNKGGLLINRHQTSDQL